jgi:hypothetical protein
MFSIFSRPTKLDYEKILTELEILKTTLKLFSAALQLSLEIVLLEKNQQNY